MEPRRPLTAAAASAVLIGLMFVPSASASVSGGAHPSSAPAPKTAEVRLASGGSGGADTTPYLIEGPAFLGVGAGLVLCARRITRA